jgi:hypothetical protein
MQNRRHDELDDPERPQGRGGEGSCAEPDKCDRHTERPELACRGHAHGELVLLLGRPQVPRRELDKLRRKEACRDGPLLKGAALTRAAHGAAVEEGGVLDGARPAGLRLD